MYNINKDENNILMIVLSLFNTLLNCISSKACTLTQSLNKISHVMIFFITLRPYICVYMINIYICLQLDIFFNQNIKRYAFRLFFSIDFEFLSRVYTYIFKVFQTIFFYQMEWVVFCDIKYICTNYTLNSLVNGNWFLSVTVKCQFISLL